MFGPDFNLWFREGMHHILTIEALDHILFVTALCLAYGPVQWKKTLILVTAFTVGHSITLAAVALGYIQVNTKWVEFLIPVTIAFTAAEQIFFRNNNRSAVWILYITVLFFGFIHGMAFGATPIASLYGRSEAIPLVLGFNLGIEVAQLVVVAGVLGLSYVLTRWCKIPERYWQLLVSSCILVYSVYLAIKNHPF